MIAFDDDGSLFFIHERIGQYGDKIKIVKFRSMNSNKEITKVGHFIRKYRIDELPQLVGVIKGDLSLIGPRPEVPSLVQIYEKDIPYYGLRHMVKPGLSGWAQIKQRIPPKFDAEIQATYLKISYDLFYLKHRSILLDLYIALQTIKEIVSRKGI
jgi:lipopolysaccharide/colanic/teichoic acid biosynthesis glycosyltransferase